MPLAMKRIVYWLGIPAGLLILLGVLIDIFDRALLAGPGASLIEGRTGRDLAFENADIRWRPLGLRLEGVRFANATWGSDRPMLEVERIDVTLDPLRLLQGPPYAQVALHAPRLRLEVGEQGQGNWQLDLAQPTEEPSSPLRLPVSLLVEDADLLYLDDSVELEYRMVVDTLRVTPAPMAEEGQSIDLHLLAMRDATRLEADASAVLLTDSLRGRFSLRLDESDALGQFEVDFAERPLVARATLESEMLVPAQITALLPHPQVDEDQTPNAYLPLPEWNDLDLRLDVRLAAIQLEGMTLHDVETTLRLQERFAALAPFTASLGDATLSGDLRLDMSVPRPELQGHFELAETGFATLPSQFGLSEVPGEASGSLQFGLELPDGQLPLLPETVLAHLAVTDGWANYIRDDAELRLQTSVAPYGGPPGLSLILNTPQAAAVEARLQAPPLREIGQGDYPLELRVQTDGAQALLRARLDGVLPEEGMEVTLEASGTHLPPFPAFGFIPPAVPEFSLSGRLGREGEDWWLRELDLAYGPSRLLADLSLSLSGEKPRLRMEARAPFVDLRALIADAEEVETAGGELPELPEELEENVEQETESLSRALNALDFDLALEAERVVLNDALTVDAARLQASLSDGSLRVEPLAFNLGGGTLNGSLHIEAAELPVNGHLSLFFEALRPSVLANGLEPLEAALGPLTGEVELPFAELPAGAGAADVLLPALGRLSLNGSELRLHSERDDTELSMRLYTSGVQTEEESLLRLDGSGRFRGAPLNLLVEGGGLQALRDPSQPYPLHLTLEAADARLQADGQLEVGGAVPFALQTEVTARTEGGEALQQMLEPWLNGPLPPFALSGSLAYDGQGMVLRGLDAELGASQLAGDVELLWEAREGPPRLHANLRSSHLDIAQLRELLAPPQAEGPAPEDAASSDEAPPQSVFPETEFDLALLQRMEVDARLAIEAMSAGERDLGAFQAVVVGQDGRLVADPLRWGTGRQGAAQLRAELRVRDPLLAGVVELELRRLDLTGLLGEIDLAGNEPGMLGGEGKFWLRGNSPAALIGSLDGGLLLIMAGGRLNPLLVEASGLDVGESVLEVLGRSDIVPIDCSFINIHAQQGQIDIDNFVIDSADTTFYLDGSVNLGSEEIDLTFYPEPKDPSLPAAGTPIDIGGYLAQPEINVLTGELAAGALSSLVLGAVAGPAAALLPFVETGEGEDTVVCENWDQRVQEEVG